MDGYQVLYGKLGCCTNANAGLKECIETINEGMHKRV